MHNAHLTGDLLQDFAFECSERRFAYFHASTRRGPMARSISLAHEKDATRRIEHGSKNTE
jgi:hypothetical protein